MPSYVDTFRATVAPADCDHLGHMNVQHYFATVSDGMFALMARVGLDPDAIRRRQLSFVAVRAEADFHQELRAGDVIALESSISGSETARPLSIIDSATSRPTSPP